MRHSLVPGIGDVNPDLGPNVGIDLHIVGSVLAEI